MIKYKSLCPRCSTASSGSVEFRDTIEIDGVLSCLNCGLRQGRIMVGDRTHTVVILND